MKKFGYIIILIHLIVFYYGCTEDVPYTGETFDDNELVVLGFFGPDSGMRVIVQRPSSFKEEDSMMFNIRAQVILEDSSGRRWTIDSVGPGIYKSLNIKPYPGNSYRLIVSSPGYKVAVSDWVRLPSKIKLRSLTWTKDFDIHPFLISGCDSTMLENSKYMYHMRISVPPDVKYFSAEINDSLGYYSLLPCYKNNYSYKNNYTDTNTYFVLVDIPKDTIDDKYELDIYSYTIEGKYFYDYMIININYGFIWKQSYSNIKNGIGAFIIYNETRKKIPIR